MPIPKQEPKGVPRKESEIVLGLRAVDETGHVVFHSATIVDDEADGVWLAGLPKTLTVISVGQEFVRHGDRVEVISDQGAQG